ncbi:hypothetical protein D3C80_1144720 [compost metagenome]
MLSQLSTAGVVFNLVLDNLRRGTAGIVFARTEQIGVVALPFVTDQFLQLLKGKTRQARKAALTFAFQLRQFACQRTCECGFSATVSAHKCPAFACAQSDIRKGQRLGVAKTKRALRNMQ